MIKSYSAFMDALKTGEVVRVRHHPSQYEENVELLIASTMVGLHFEFQGQIQIIPHVPASRTRIIDNGRALDIYRNNGTLWWTVTRDVAIHESNV